MSHTLRRAYWILSILLIGGIVCFCLLSKKESKVSHTVFVPLADSLSTAPQHDDKRSSSFNSQRRIYTKEDFKYHQQQKESNSFRDEVRQTGQKKPLQIDLNTADTITLQLLYGIGPAYARRIVRYRQLLGGFVDKHQLLEVYGFDQERYDRIASQLTIDTNSIKKIDLNTISIKQLMKHPYIDPYQARDIITFRNKGHRFTSVEDLRLIPTIDDSTYRKIAPYIIGKL